MMTRYPYDREREGQPKAGDSKWKTYTKWR
jgi:hypothetical protein